MQANVWEGKGFFPEFPQICQKKILCPDFPPTNFSPTITWRPFFQGHSANNKFVSCDLHEKKKIFIFFGGMDKKSNSDVFDQSVSLITKIEQSCLNICAQLFRDFVQYYRDFARIFDKSKLLWVCLHPQLLCSNVIDKANLKLKLKNMQFSIFACFWSMNRIARKFIWSENTAVKIALSENPNQLLK